MAGVFISYRREDTSGYVGRLRDVLVAHFGATEVFQDLEIEPGLDFRGVIAERIEHCAVQLVMIGPRWLAIADHQDRIRIHQPDDVVRAEIKSALSRSVRVIPVLVQGARMVQERDLPEDIRPLGTRNAIELSDQRWSSDVQSLIRVVERVIGSAASRQNLRAELAYLAVGKKALILRENAIATLGMAAGLASYSLQLRFSVENIANAPVRILRSVSEFRLESGWNIENWSGDLQRRNNVITNAEPAFMAPNAVIERVISIELSATSDAQSLMELWRFWEPPSAIEGTSYATGAPIQIATEIVFNLFTEAEAEWSVAFCAALNDDPEDPTPLPCDKPAA